MRGISTSELRKTLASTLDRVVDDHDPVLILRHRGKPAAVLISLEDFAAYDDTAHLLGYPRHAKRLLESIRELESTSTN